MESWQVNLELWVMIGINVIDILYDIKELTNNVHLQTDQPFPIALIVDYLTISNQPFPFGIVSSSFMDIALAG